MNFQISSVQLQGDRAEQEDRLVGRFTDNGVLIALVADGLGGHPNGGQAAEVGIEVVSDALEAVLARPMQSLREGLVRAFLDGHHAIPKRVRGRGIHRPGTAMIGGVFVPLTGQACLGSVGDSSSWLLRDGVMERISVRQDIACSLGIYVGGGDADEEGDQIEVVEPDLQVGDVILLASDGLDPYDRRDLREALRLPTAVDAAESIAAMVLEERLPRRDNTSFIVVRVCDGETQAK